MTPTEYEKAVLEFFRTHWPSPEFEIKHNIRLLGRKTKGRRQIDAGIFGAGQSGTNYDCRGQAAQPSD
jgi:hypothetical protein